MMEKRLPHAGDSVLLIVIAVLIHLGGSLLIRWTSDPAAQGMIEIFRQIGWPLAVFAYCFVTGLDVNEAAYFRFPSVRGALLAVLVAISMFWMLTAWKPVQDWMFDQFRYSPREDYQDVRRTVEQLKKGGVFFAILTAAVWAPFREEIVFRGMGLAGAFRSWGPWAALFLTSISFGILHETIGRFFITAALGFSFGYIAICTRSVWAAMLAHGINNTMAIYLDRPVTWPLVATSAVVVSLAAVLLWKEKQRREESPTIT